MIYGFVNGRKAKVHTYADMIYMWIWMGFLIAGTVLFIVHSKSLDTVAPYIMLLAGFPTFVSGFIIKFKPLIAGGICFWIFALFVHFAGPSIAPLGIPVAVHTGYLIPGYMLKSKIDHDTV
jgi:FtsH-binding integral membrane protein